MPENAMPANCTFIPFVFLEKDGPWPEPNELVLVRLKDRAPSIDVSHGHEKTTVTGPQFAFAALDFVKDGFGGLHPSKWNVIGLRSPGADEKSKGQLATCYYTSLELNQITGWARIVGSVS